MVGYDCCLLGLYGDSMVARMPDILRHGECSLLVLHDDSTMVETTNNLV